MACDLQLQILVTKKLMVTGTINAYTKELQKGDTPLGGESDEILCWCHQHRRRFTEIHTIAAT
jgi:hypothetical protein